MQKAGRALIAMAVWASAKVRGDLPYKFGRQLTARVWACAHLAE